MILALKNIMLAFAKGKDSFRILDGLNLNVPKGKITALAGGNGTGKTTLFNVISGFQKDFDGEIVFDNKRIDKLPPHRVAQKGVGRLFQGNGLLSDLTLLENMKLNANNTAGETPFSHLFRKKKLKTVEMLKEMQSVEILKDLFGENNKYQSMLHTTGSDFSYGEQRLLSLAGLFMGDYSLLLLDEPTAGVNPVYIEQIKRIIRQMTVKGKTILLIEHNMQFVGNIADKVAYLNEGRIQFEGTASEVLNNQEVKNSYLGVG
jgi:ABC-type branched-subunit amino acid transport system ATPase component